MLLFLNILIRYMPEKACGSKSLKKSAVYTWCGLFKDGYEYVIDNSLKPADVDNLISLRRGQRPVFHGLFYYNA